jgi:hypothetical protein
MHDGGKVPSGGRACSLQSDAAGGTAGHRAVRVASRGMRPRPRTAGRPRAALQSGARWPDAHTCVAGWPRAPIQRRSGRQAMEPSSAAALATGNRAWLRRWHAPLLFNGNGQSRGSTGESRVSFEPVPASSTCSVDMLGLAAEMRIHGEIRWSTVN